MTPLAAIRAHVTDDAMNECACGRWESWAPDAQTRFDGFTEHVASMLPPGRSAVMLVRVMVAALVLLFVAVVVVLVARRADWVAWAILVGGTVLGGFGVWDGRAR